MELINIGQNLPLTAFDLNNMETMKKNPALMMGTFFFSHLVRASGVFKTGTDGMLSMPPIYSEMLVNHLAQELASQHEAQFQKLMLNQTQTRKVGEES